MNLHGHHRGRGCSAAPADQTRRPLSCRPAAGRSRPSGSVGRPPSHGCHSGSATPCHKTVRGDTSVRQDGPAPRCLGRNVGPVPRGAHGVGRLGPWWRQPSFQRPTASPVVAARPPAPRHFLLRPSDEGPACSPFRAPHRSRTELLRRARGDPAAHVQHVARCAATDSDVYAHRQVAEPGAWHEHTRAQRSPLGALNVEAERSGVFG